MSLIARPPLRRPAIFADSRSVLAPLSRCQPGKRGGVAPPNGCTTHFVIRRKAAAVKKLDEFVSHFRRRRKTTDQNGCDGSARISRERKVPVHPLMGKDRKIWRQEYSCLLIFLSSMFLSAWRGVRRVLSDGKMTGREINPCDKRLKVLTPARILDTTRTWDADLRPRNAQRGVPRNPDSGILTRTTDFYGCDGLERIDFYFPLDSVASVPPCFRNQSPGLCLRGTETQRHRGHRVSSMKISAESPES
jgi:hypothetical protein